MRILFILKDPFAVDLARNALKGMAEPDSIYFVHDFFEAQNYIDNQVVKDQLPLDMIITHDKIDRGLAIDFKNKLTASPQRIYSNYDFNLDKLPVILLAPKRAHLQFFEKAGFAAFIHDPGEEELDKSAPAFQRTLKKWRRSVVDEMDNLGIRYNSGVVDYTYYFEKVKRYVDTKILSENFKQFPRKLNYYWLENNKRQIELAIDQFIKLLKRTHPDNKRHEEKLYHRFFNDHKFFLTRDRYSDSWYEQRLPYDIRKYHEPDYSLKTNMNYETDLNILEVKLPNEAFVKRSNFHTTLLSRVFSHLGQINDYKDYLESGKFDEIIQAKYGWRPGKISYQLLMGRQKDKDDHLETIETRMRQFGQAHIYMMTYDELLEYQVRYLDRFGFLEID